jgi:CHAT domain-containing protein/tetratricopeptide (TPR) repeat protein
MLLHLARYLKRRWPLAAVVVTTPLLLGLIFAWVTEPPRTGRVESAPRPVQPPRPPRPTVAADPSLDRRQQIKALGRQLAELREAAVPNPVDIGRILLRLGNLQSATGEDQAAAVALGEIGVLHSDAGHWQAREAAARLAALDKIATGPAFERERWRTALNRQLDAEALHAAGRFREAIGAAEEALTLRRRLWGAGHVETAESQIRLAWLATEHADSYLRAEGLAREALEAARQALGEDHPAFGDCLYVLATLADDRGDFNVADRLYEQTLDNYRRCAGELSREYARALNRQGRMHNVWWKDFAAGKSFKALEIRERILDKEHPDCAESREDAAELQYGLLHYEQAEPQLERALEIRRRRQGEEHPDLARPYTLLAACQAEQGKLSQALVNIRRALNLTERWRGAGHLQMAERQVRLGKVCIRTNDYAVGYRALKKARETLSELGMQKHPTYCEAIFQQAESLRCDATYHLNEEEASGMAAAQPIMEEAVDAYRGLPEGEKIGYFADALLSLSRIHYMLNYPGETRQAARDLIDEAEKVINRNGGVMHPLYASVRTAQGRFCIARGYYEDGLKYESEGAERIQQQVGTAAPWLYVEALQALVGAYLHQGEDLATARELGRESFELYSEMYHRNAAGESDSSRLAAMGDTFAQLSGNLSIGAATNDLASLYDMVLALRGAATFFQTAHQLAHDRPDLQRLLQKIIAERQVLKERVFSDDPGQPRELWIERLLEASERKEYAECELAIAIRPLVPEEPPLTWRDVQSVLAENTAFIDFIQYVHHASPPGHSGRLVRELRVLAYIVSRSRAPVCVPLGKSSDIERGVTAWQNAIVDLQSGGSGAIDAPAVDLARLIWFPLLPHLADVEELYIAPDGPLCFASFAALPMPGRESRTYALERYGISYVNSGRWLYQQLRNETPPAGKGLLVCGGIAYQPDDFAPPREAQPRAGLLSEVQGMKNLPASALEIGEVAKLYAKNHSPDPRSRELVGAQSDAQEFQLALDGNWRYIHFAGHGFFIQPDEVPALSGRIETLGQNVYFVQRNQLLLSGLVLAPRPGRSSVLTLLTAEEVGSLNLRGTDMVVLSACETGLGCTWGADGVLGLTRAFLTAGSRNVVSSLWKVEDAATSLLMEQFYQNLWKTPGMSKREALRRAQIAVLNGPERISERTQLLALRGIKTGAPIDLERVATEPGRSHPALWAAFVLNGDGR